MTESPPSDALERIEWLRYNARATPRDRITLYACKGYDTTCDTAQYRVKDGTSVWTLAGMPSSYDRDDYSAWRALRWPATLDDADLGKLARGWTLRYGFAATKEAAIAYRVERAKTRIDDISRELVDAHAFVRVAEGMVAA